MQNNRENQFKEALHYIMNSADVREIDVFEAALQKRKQGLQFRMGQLGINPKVAAKQMSESIEASLQASMGGVRNTFRTFAKDLVAKEAPELTPKQMEQLIDSWIPGQKKTGTAKSIASTKHNVKINGLPNDALYDMILQFVSFSIEEMPPEEDVALRAGIGEWPSKYWNNFPTEIRVTIKSFLNGEITSKHFDQEIRTTLQLP